MKLRGPATILLSGLLSFLALRGTASVVIVTPGDASWFGYVPATGLASITSSNPRAGNGSLELTKDTGDGTAFIHGESFGTWGKLTAFSYDWFIDPADNRSLPPEPALRVYAFDDPRSFFLHWTCPSEASGTWLTTDLLPLLSIQQAGTNEPPSSLADIPADAPITEIHLRSNYNFGDPWHGFVDDVTLGFGSSITTFNFEVPEPSSSLIMAAAACALVTAKRRKSAK